MKLKISHYVYISLAITAILIPIAYKSLTEMTLDTSIHQIMGTDSRTKDTYEKFNKAFKNDMTVIAIAKIDELFSNKGAKTLYELSSTFQSIDGLKEIKSLTHSARPVKGELSFDIRKMVKFKTFLDLQPKSDEEWKKLKNFTTEYPMTRDILVSSDGQYALIIAVMENTIESIGMKKDLLNLTKSKIKPFQDKGIEIKLLSEHFLAAEFQGLVNEFLLYFITISLSLLTITIYLTFGSLKILVLIISYQIAGFLIFPPIFHINLTSINVFTFIIIPLVSALHLTFLTHFFSVFQEESHKSNNLKKSLKRTLRTVLKPSIIALITSAIGLGSLSLSEIEALKVVGLVGLEALLGVFIITFAPAILLSLGKIEEKEDTESTEPSFSPLINFTNKNKYIFLFLVLVSAGIVGSQISKINTDVRIKEFLVNKSETRAALNLLDEHFGGINILQLKVQTDKENGIQDYEIVTYLHLLRNEAMELEGVLNAYTYSQFYTTIHQLFL
ncbi:MAG: MMPL family transporter, partial [Lentisphaeraceae bacterium]|nr:MMPL family transporter [Lentisphaeraceae bacterium]